MNTWPLAVRAEDAGFDAVTSTLLSGKATSSVQDIRNAAVKKMYTHLESSI